MQTGSEGQAQSTQVKCQNCGAPGNGKFCSACGAPLTGKPANSYLLFVDSFFEISDLREYLETYWRILCSPVRATIWLFETSTFRDALRFLQYGAAVLILLFISRIIAVQASNLVSELLVSTYFVLAQSIAFFLHYQMGRLMSKRGRSFDEFMRLTCIFFGFTLPISGVVQSVSLANRTVASILIILLTVPLLVYAVRVWRYFWRLPAGVVFLFLFLSALPGALIGLLFIFLVGILFA